MTKSQEAAEERERVTRHLEAMESSELASLQEEQNKDDKMETTVELAAKPMDEAEEGKDIQIEVKSEKNENLTVDEGQKEGNDTGRESEREDKLADGNLRDAKMGEDNTQFVQPPPDTLLKSEEETEEIIQLAKKGGASLSQSPEEDNGVKVELSTLTPAGG